MDKQKCPPHLISAPFLTEFIKLASEVGLKQTCEQHRTGSPLGSILRPYSPGPTGSSGAVPQLKLQAAHHSLADSTLLQQANGCDMTSRNARRVTL